MCQALLAFLVLACSARGPPHPHSKPPRKKQPQRAPPSRLRTLCLSGVSCVGRSRSAPSDVPVPVACPGVSNSPSVKVPPFKLDQ
ncbi:hypothetical protein V8E36_004295 [Tilletia maclaganii]